MRDARDALRQGSSPDWAEMRLAPDDRRHDRLRAQSANAARALPGPKWDAPDIASATPDRRARPSHFHAMGTKFRPVTQGIFQ